MSAVNCTYSVAGLVDAVRREIQHAPGMPGTFDQGASWALGNIEGRASRADQLHALINDDDKASRIAALEDALDTLHMHAALEDGPAPGWVMVPRVEWEQAMERAGFPKSENT